jgi:CBS domain containing-hemolysin-like protein
MLDAVFHFERLLCRQVMVPRGEVDFLTIDSTLPECIELARKTQHTRYPLCRGSLDEVLGIVHVKDLMGRAPGEKTDLLSISRPANHVPETKRIHELLNEMQRSHQHMAIVVDEHGSTAGVITLENILEEIVGSVQDEFDRERPDFRREDSHTYVVRGSTVLGRLNREMGLELKEPGVNTLSGLLAARLGRFPEKSDLIQLQGAVAEVLSVTGSQADQVRLKLEKREGEH